MNQSPSQVLAQHGKSFHWASKLLPASRRDDAALLYAFCRWLDDLADEQGSAAAPELEQVRFDLDQGNSAQPLVQDFLRLAEKRDIPIQAAHDLIDGLMTDLDEPVLLPDEPALEQYAYRVAGAVGLMMCPVIGVTDKAAWPFAIDLGMGMQFTNIARDVLEDAKMGRRYLPGTWVQQAAPIHLSAPATALKQRSAEAVSRLLEKAETHYQSGLSGLGFIPTSARFGIATAAVIYRQIGRKLRNNSCQWWLGRTTVGSIKKADLTLRSGLPAAVFAGKPKSQHQSALHQNLSYHQWLS